MNNQFNNRTYNISIIQNISYFVASIKIINVSEIILVIGPSCSMCLTDRTFLQTHVTFYEYLVFHEF